MVSLKMPKLASLPTAVPCVPVCDSPSGVARLRLLAAPLFFAGLVIASLLWTYGPVLSWLMRTWSRDPDYSHGYLVLPFAAALIWVRRRELADGSLAMSRSAIAAGAALIVLSGIARSAGIYAQIITLEALSIVPCLAGIALCSCGWRAVRVVWPAVAFLVFMIPLPSGIAAVMSGQLQRVATVASTFVLQLFGLPAVSEGNVIWLSETQIGVAEACSGLRMLVSFAALAVGASLLLRRPLWEKAVMIASVPVLAIIANVARVTATGAAYEFGSAELADRIFHDLAGWLMMPLGLALLFAELAVLSRVFLPANQGAAFQPHVRRAPHVFQNDGPRGQHRSERRKVRAR